MNCSNMGPSHGVQSFRSRLLQCGSPVGSQALPANLLQRGLLSPRVRRSWQEPAPSRGHSLPWASTCSSVRSSMGCKWISAPLWTSIDCRRTACLTMVFSTGCRGISAPAPGAPPPPPSALTLVSAEWFHILLLFSPLLLPHSLVLFPTLLNYVIPEALPASLMGSALASSGSVLEPADTGFVGHRGSFWQLLTEATPVVPPATKTLLRKANTVFHKYNLFWMDIHGFVMDK